MEHSSDLGKAGLPRKQGLIIAGDAAQQPDAVYEAAVGAGNAPAYRGRATVLIESLDLGPSGQLPVLTFEVIENATVFAPTFVETEQHPAHMWHIESGYRDLSGADGNFAYVDKYTAYCATATALGTVGTDIAVSSGKRYFEIEILDSSSSAVEALWFWVKDGSNNTYGSNYHAYWCTSDGSNVALINFRSDGSVIQPNGGALYDGVVKIALDSASGQMAQVGRRGRRARIHAESG